jgi:hypothetical protein
MAENYRITRNEKESKKNSFKISTKFRSFKTITFEKIKLLGKDLDKDFKRNENNQLGEKRKMKKKMVKIFSFDKKCLKCHRI